MSESSWMRRLLDRATGRSGEDFAAQMNTLRRGCVERAARLATAAELAPYQGAALELRRLAEEQTEMADRIRRVGQEQGIELDDSTVPPGVRSYPGSSHWSRLVQLLELNQEVRGEVRDVAIRIGDRHPELAPLLAELSRMIESHLGRLRSLIAMADPQAADS
jgi:hypothetical protein